MTGSGTTYNVAVTGMTTSGTVIATVITGRATDAAYNNNGVDVDRQHHRRHPPTVTINW